MPERRNLPYNRNLVARARELRKETTEPERKLWLECLRHFPHRVLRQRPISGFIVDFYCPTLKLVIEVDGESHFTPEAQAYNLERTQKLEGLGLQILRFNNSEVLENLEGVRQHLHTLLEVLDKAAAHGPVRPRTS